MNIFLKAFKNSVLTLLFHSFNFGFASSLSPYYGHNFCKKGSTESWRINGRCQKSPVCKNILVLSELNFQFRHSAEKEASDEAEPGEDPCDICAGIRQGSEVLPGLSGLVLCLTWSDIRLCKKVLTESEDVYKAQ